MEPLSTYCQFINILKAAFFMLPFFLTACLITHNDETRKIEEYELLNSGYEIHLAYKPLNKSIAPRPRHFYDENTNRSFFYQVKLFPPYIHKMEIINDRLQVLDSFKIPDLCIEGNAAYLEAFYVLDTDKILFIPRYFPGGDDKVVCMDSKGEKEYDLPDVIHKSEADILLGSFYGDFPIHNNYVYARVHYPFANEEEKKTTLREKVVIVNLSDTADSKTIFPLPSELSALDKDVYLTLMGDEILYASPLELKIYSYNLVTGINHIHDVSTKGIDKPFKLKENIDYYQSLYESDHIKQIRYNPYDEELWVEVHKKDGYYSDDGFTRKNFFDADRTLLIYDKQFNLKGKMEIPDSLDIVLFFMQPTPGGAYLLYSSKDPGGTQNYNYRKYELHKADD